jgi:hypothetical protein
MAVGLAIVAGLGWFYVAGATEHALVVNRSKARGDQSAYLWEAQILYRNWHGLNDPPVIQPRNRMPLYPAFLATFYTPQWSDDEYFEVAKIRSVYLSLALVGVIGLAAWRHLPPLAAVNFALIVAFGCFVFRAGYVQAELLFYTLHFLTFLACWHLFTERPSPRAVAYGLLAGALAALAHLTKAAMLPFVAIAVAVIAGRALVAWIRTRTPGAAMWRIGSALALTGSFLAVMYPYISTSKRIHGDYFYNLNTAVLAWYDDYPQGAGALLTYGPDGWPAGPPSMRPGPLNYWRSHTSGEIARRLARGFRDMAVQSYQTFWHLKYVVLYLLGVLLVAATRWSAIRRTLARHPAVILFCGLYAAVYLPAIAFYEPISGTGTMRFLLPHVAPLLFALSALLAGRAAREQRWTVRGLTLTTASFHLFVAATVAFDIVFLVWWRLMTTYGGF